MRITMLAASVGNPFGQERVLSLSSAALQAAGHEVSLLTDLQVGAPTLPTIAVEGMSSIHPLTDSNRVGQILQGVQSALERFQPEVVHFIDFLDERILEVARRFAPAVLTAHTVAPTCPASTRQSRKQNSCSRSSGYGCLLGHYQHGCLGYLKSDIHRAHAIYGFLKRKRAYQSAISKAFVISEYVRECFLLDGWESSKVQIVPNPVEHFSANQTALKKSGQTLVCSRLTSLKGVDTVLKAASQLGSAHFQLVICGDGPEREKLESLAQKLNLAQRVKFVGSQPFEKVAEWMRQSAIFIQANRGPEAFGMALAEAMSAGCACIGTEVPAIPELIANDKTGLLVKKDSAESLADAWKKLLTDSSLTATLGKNARATIQERFSIQKHLDKTLEGYHEVSRPSGHQQSFAASK